MPIILLPSLLIFLIKKSTNQTKKQKFITLVKLAAAGMATAILLYLPFLKEKKILMGAYMQQTLLFCTSLMSPLPLLLALGGINNFVIKIFCRIFFIILILIIAKSFICDNGDLNLNLSKYWSYTIIALLLTSVFWLTSWYILWPLPFLLVLSLNPKKKQQALELVMLFSLIGLLDYVLPMSYLILLLPSAYFLFKFLLDKNNLFDLKFKF